MGSVRLYAISIDEVRDIFRATEDTARTLRGLAAERFATTAPAAPGLLGKLGPVLRRPPDAPVVRPGVPSGSDVDTLLAGRYVAPHRLGACWTLLEAWLDVLAWGAVGREVTETQLNNFDFDLACSEVPARYGLRSLLKSDLGIALLPCPGLAAGWAPLAHAQEMAAAWRPAVSRLQPEHREAAVALLDWLNHFPAWVDAAARHSRPSPDLVAILRA